MRCGKSNRERLYRIRHLPRYSILANAPAADQRHQTMLKQTRRTSVLAENRTPRLSARARSAQNVNACVREPGKTICQRTEIFRKKEKYAMDVPPTQRPAHHQICHASKNLQNADSSSAWQILVHALVIWF